jgi:hypothetical protein
MSRQHVDFGRVPWRPRGLRARSRGEFGRTLHDCIKDACQRVFDLVERIIRIPSRSRTFWANTSRYSSIFPRSNSILPKCVRVRAREPSLAFLV